MVSIVCLQRPCPCCVELTVDLARIDLVLDNLGALSIDLASDREGSAQDLLDGAGKSLGERLEPHGPGNVDDLLKRDRLAVLDVLLLLAVTWGLLESTNDERGGGGDDGDGGLTVLDGELDRDAEALLFVCNDNSSAPLCSRDPAPEPQTRRPGCVVKEGTRE